MSEGWGAWRKASASLSNGNCVECRWEKSSYSSHSGNCVEWRKSSHSTPNGQCVEWRTSSYSESTDCVEVASGPLVQVRDSKNPDGGVLTVGTEEWAAFTAAIKAGEFSL
jgi:Domain of unknown function (DUF397)